MMDQLGRPVSTLEDPEIAISWKYGLWKTWLCIAVTVDYLVIVAAEMEHFDVDVDQSLIFDTLNGILLALWHDLQSVIYPAK